MSYASGEPIVYDANNDNITNPGEQLFSETHPSMVLHF